MPQNRYAWFDEQLRKYDRIAIIGPPRCGKTTLAKRVKDRHVFWSDDYKKYEWSEASRRLAEDMNALPRFVAEGVAVVRAIRKGATVDVALLLQDPVVPQIAGQKNMGTGIMTILADVRKQQPGLLILSAPPPPKGFWDEEEAEDDQE